MFEIIIEAKGKFNQKDFEDTAAIEAIETIYNFTDDNIVIFKWGELEFIASLKYDISDSWLGIIRLMENLKSDKKEFDMQFPSQTFWHYWKFQEVEKDYWEMEAFWSHEKQNKIKVLKNVVENEFQKLINQVESDLIKQGYLLHELREYSTK